MKDFLHLPPHERVIGPFRLLRPLGSGGFGAVWQAEEVYAEVVLRAVAIKLFAVPVGEAGRKKRSEIFAEARRLCQVEHPNVVRFFSLQTDDSRGLMGLVMELVEGQSLERKLGAGAMSLRDVIDVGIAVGAALEATHDAGLVHRDVKPANIVEAQGVYKLIDFGIAAADSDAVAMPVEPRQIVLDDLPLVVGTKLSRVASSLGGGTMVGWTSGTVGYIDPALMSAPRSKATAASDLYSLGATLYECLTGKVPAAQGEGLSGEILDGRATPPSLQGRSDLPDGLGRLVDELLTPEAGTRPRSAALVVRRLQQVRAGLSGRRRRLPPEEQGPFAVPLDASSQDFFFGRSADVGAVLSLLLARPLVALVGPAGVGKTSLVQAGILPAIHEGGLGALCPSWEIFDAPAGEYLARLAAWSEAPAQASEEELCQALVAHAERTGSGVLLVVEQDGSMESQASLLSLLQRVAERSSPALRALLVVRQEQLDALAANRQVGASVLRGAHVVHALSAAQWGDVLDQSTSAYGYRIEPAALRDEVAGELADAPMRLSRLTMARWWGRSEQKLLTRQGYEAIGGSVGTIAGRAEEVFEQHVARHPELFYATKTLLLALTTADGAARSRSVDEVNTEGAEAQAALAFLLREQIVTRDARGLSLAHPSLPSRWGRLSGWIHELADQRRLVRELERDADDWQRDRAPERLWRGRRLSSVRGEIDRGARPSQAARAFLAASLGAQRRRRALLAALLALAAAALALLYVGPIRGELADIEQALREARDAERVARERAIAAGADAHRRAQEVESLRGRVQTAERRLLELCADRPADPALPPKLASAARVVCESADGKTLPYVQNGADALVERLFLADLGKQLGAKPQRHDGKHAHVVILARPASLPTQSIKDGKTVITRSWSLSVSAHDASGAQFGQVYSITRPFDRWPSDKDE